VPVAGRRLGFWRRFAVATVKPPLLGWTRRDWRGMEHIPREGGAILVANHHSEMDPLVVAHFVYDAGRWPQFLAKSGLFTIPLFGPFLRAVRQIPVYRGTADAARALDAAAAAVKAGDAVIIYPEGTTPKSGSLWPRRGKTGVARLWLTTGAPVIPIANWGAQEIYDPRTRRLRVRPRTPVSVVAGPPIDLSAFAGAPATGATLQQITDVIMDRLRGMLTTELGVHPDDPQPGTGVAEGGRR
jgi:1-acyl-sn-glycerol-3-phosphate acyltransferase